MTIFHTARRGAGPRWELAINLSTAMGSESYCYDRVSRLISSTRTGGENLTYAPFGNLINYNGRTLSVLGTTKC